MTSRAGRATGPGRAGRAVTADGGTGDAPDVRADGRGGEPADRRGGDRGGATVCLLAIGLVFVVVGAFGAAVGAARVARQRAGVAADFGALAAAGRALSGNGVACGAAEAIVRANGARVVGCRVDGLDAVVTAEVAVAPAPGLTRVATVTSRAGPPRG
ncbi:helicase [Micromonospora sp. KC207]|uniref:Rv3654c family TadE-like protein n=1 Tax=Micromonospora sp. KC207 TaxID=2530377 RepID=UPI00104410A2|nr:helicase [Micromonospora sp. KC207]